MDALHDELLVLVFEHLDLGGRAAVSIICRRFYSIVISLLYGNLSFEPGDYDRHLTEVSLLLRLVVERPHLARRMDSLHL